MMMMMMMIITNNLLRGSVRHMNTWFSGRSSITPDKKY